MKASFIHFLKILSLILFVRYGGGIVRVKGPPSRGAVCKGTDCVLQFDEALIPSVKVLSLILFVRDGGGIVRVKGPCAPRGKNIKGSWEDPAS